MSAALAELKRNALAATAALESAPTRASLDAEIAALESELGDISAWEQQVERGKQHGANHPAPDPKHKAAIVAELAKLRSALPHVEMISNMRSAAADQAEKVLRHGLREALNNGPRRVAFENFHLALDQLGRATAELMGWDYAIELQHRKDYEIIGYGPVEGLVKMLDELTMRTKRAESLRPAWLPVQSGVRVESIPGVSEAKTTALAWLAAETGA